MERTRLVGAEMVTFPCIAFHHRLRRLDLVPDFKGS